MRLSTLLFGLTALLSLVLFASSFVTMATTGGSAFDECWPYLLPPICVLALLSIVCEFLMRKNPERWIFRSVWPRAILAILLVSGAAFLLFGVLF